MSEKKNSPEEFCCKNDFSCNEPVSCECQGICTCEALDYEEKTDCNNCCCDEGSEEAFDQKK